MTQLSLIPRPYALLACAVLAWRARANRIEADRIADLLIRELRGPV